MAIIKVPDTDSFDLWRQKTNLISLSQGDLNRLTVPLTFPINGLVSSFADSLVGVGTTFLTDLTVGTRVKDIAGGVERVIVEITSNTTAKTDTAFTPALINATLTTVDIVSALNAVYAAVGNSQRDILIKAIAMS